MADKTEIYNIIKEACINLEFNDEFELESKEFQQVWRESGDDFQGEDYFIMCDIQGDEGSLTRSVALLKFKKNKKTGKIIM
jgi:hypothetical protein